MGLRRAYKNWCKRKASVVECSETVLVQPNSGLRSPIYLGSGMLLAETFFHRKIYLDASDVSLTPHIAFDGRWENWVAEFFQREIKPGDVFLDIGANCGFFSVLAAHFVGSEGAVIALEPQARLTTLIQRSFVVNGFDQFSRVITKAVGAIEGTAELAKNDLLSGSASLVSLLSSQVGTETVSVAPLNAVLRDAEVELGRKLTPTVIKIDAEGYERFIWDGARDVFAYCERLTICLEFSPDRYRELNQDPLAFLQMMRADGFEIAKLDTKSREVPLNSDQWEELLETGTQSDLILRKGT